MLRSITEEQWKVAREYVNSTSFILSNEKSEVKREFGRVVKADVYGDAGQ